MAVLPPRQQPFSPQEPFAAERKQPWRKPAGLAALLERWRDDPRIARNLTLDERLPGRGADCVPLPDELASPIRSALAARGIRELYRHQRAAFEHAQRGRDLVIATPTASGKSLCYSLP